MELDVQLLSPLQSGAHCKHGKASTPSQFVTSLKQCGRLRDLEWGKELHAQAKAASLDTNKYVASALVNMYSRCGSLHLAHKVFNKVVQPDAVLWNSLIMGYVDTGDNHLALELFASMDCIRTSVTFITALKACGNLARKNDLQKHVCLSRLASIHEQIKAHGLEADMVVCNALLHVYGRSGSMQRAREVFDGMVRKDVVTWTSLILGYVENGEQLVALDIFSCMDCHPNSFTYVAALKACTGLASENESESSFYLETGSSLHKRACDSGFQSNVLVANTLLDMYCKCSCMERAREVFDCMNKKSPVTWTCLMTGYVDNHESLIAVDLFFQMDCEPDSLTFVAGLKACACSGALRAGLHIHARVSKLGLEHEQVVSNALVDFYGKSGCMSRSLELFNSLRSPDLVSWNALITSYSSTGDCNRVFSLVKMVQEAGFRINNVTLLSVLTACSRAGLVEESRNYFDLLLRYGVKMNVEHYNSMVDVLCRANRVNEALALIHAMPVEANAVTWKTLLAACRALKSLNPEP